MSSPLPLLYSFRRCPYAMRARLAIANSQTSCELREVVLRNKPPSMIAASPKATVPVLILPDGDILEESLDIMFWALTKNDPGGWLTAPLPKAMALIERNDGPFKHHLDRYKYPNRYEDVVADDHRASGLEILRDLDQQLAGQAWLFGSQPTLADMALLPFIRQFANTDRHWFDAQALPHLQKWLSTFLESTLFLSIMHKYAPWTEGTLGVTFPENP